MKRISELPKVSSIANNDRFLLDSKDPSGAGARSISFFDLVRSSNNDYNVYQSLDDQNIPVGLRRQIFRGNSLNTISKPTEDGTDVKMNPTAVMPEFWNNIDNGSFKGMFIGDYWTFNKTNTAVGDISNIKWRIVDFDYWYGTGDIACTKHHVVIMPDVPLYEHNMNDTDTTTGGYMGSKMYTEGLNQAKQTANIAFGSEHILNHRECLTNAVTNGYTSGSTWVNSTVELPNETMIHGSHFFSNILANASSVDTVQLAAMQIDPHSISMIRTAYWLRDVVSSDVFAVVSMGRRANRKLANTQNGVRPVFGICKANA